MKNTIKSIATLAISLVAAMHSASAAVLFTHSGTTDPTSEGWTSNSLGIDVTSGSIIDSGIPAWFVNDPSIASGSFLFYSINLTPAQLSLAEANGWSMTSNLRITDVSTTTNGSPVLGFTTASRVFEIFLKGTSAGDVEVFFFNGGPTITLDGGLGGYHTYSLVGSPGGVSASLFIDGVERASNLIAPTLNGPSQALWGAGASSSDGNANFNFVEFAIIPEPSTSSIILATAALAFANRRRGHNK